MALTSFPDLLQQVHDSEGALVTINQGWAQGRAVFGGLAAAIALAAMERRVPGDMPLRSMMTNFVAPTPEGPVTTTARVMRRGRSVMQTSVDVMAGDQIVVHASAAFGSARKTYAVAPSAAFTPEPRDSVEALDAAAFKLPGFLQQFDIHWTGGGIPCSGSKDRRTGMWVRHKVNMDAFPAARIVALADIPPPVMLSHYRKPVMASSLSWSLEFVCPSDEVQGDWFYLDYTLEAAADGYSQQNGHIFSEDGTLVALSRQCMVYFE
jgi:acyl-CoA thioesterase